MVIVDTGFLYALADKKDVNHQVSLKALMEMEEESITTWPVLTETCHLLLKRLGQKSLQEFMTCLPQMHIFSLENKHVPRLRELMKKYSRLPMDLADASLVILAEAQADGRILTTDRRDFNAYRWKSTKPFINLLNSIC